MMVVQEGRLRVLCRRGSGGWEGVGDEVVILECKGVGWLREEKGCLSSGEG